MSIRQVRVSEAGAAAMMSIAIMAILFMLIVSGLLAIQLSKATIGRQLTYHGQAINAATVEKLVERGVEPFVMVSPNTTDKARANVQNDRNYAELWRRLSSR